MKKMTREYVEKNVADGKIVAELMGRYNTPGGEMEIAVINDNMIASIVMINSAGKHIVIGLDGLQRNIAAGKMVKIA
jgi:phosphopantothenoylcysteine synthetase/decarboxylase